MKTLETRQQKHQIKKQFFGGGGGGEKRETTVDTFRFKDRFYPQNIHSQTLAVQKGHCLLCVELFFFNFFF